MLDDVGKPIVSIEEAGQVLGVSERTIRRGIQAGVYLAVPIGQARNGRPQFGVLLSQLQPKVAALAPAQGPPAPGGVPVLADGMTPDAAALIAGGDGAKLIGAAEKRAAVALAEERAARSPRGRKNAAWRSVATEWGVSISTLRRWERALRAGREGELIDRRGVGRRGKHPSIPPELAKRVRALYLTEGRPTAAQVYEYTVCGWAAETGQDAPSERSVARFVAGISPLEKKLFREGPRAYRSDMGPKVGREVPAPGSAWSADHFLADIMISDAGKARRPWVTVVWDVGSGALVAYALSRQPNAEVVGQVLRQALLTWGKPDTFQRDNGREFTARRLGGRASRLRRPRTKELGGCDTWPALLDPEQEGALFAALGIRVTTCLPYAPWGKAAEPLLGAFRRWERLLPGWCGRDAKDKPERLAQHVVKGQLLSWEEFAELFARQLEKWNHEHVCGERTAPPVELYAAAQRPRIEDERALAFLLQKTGRRRVTGYGVLLDGNYWAGERLFLYTGQQVSVRWADGEAFAYLNDGEVIALRPAPKAVWGTDGPANQKARRAGREQREHLRQAAAELRDVPDSVVDPLGAYRAVAARLASEARGKRRAGEVVLLKGAGAEARRQIEAAAKPAYEPCFPVPPGSIYSEEWLDIADFDWSEDTPVRAVCDMILEGEREADAETRDGLFARAAAEFAALPAKWTRDMPPSLASALARYDVWPTPLVGRQAALVAQAKIDLDAESKHRPPDGLEDVVVVGDLTDGGELPWSDCAASRRDAAVRLRLILRELEEAAADPLYPDVDDTLGAFKNDVAAMDAGLVKDLSAQDRDLLREFGLLPGDGEAGEGAA